ncbi:MAG: hypothetical protein GEU78_05315 [Actinobacteria bacterium]|nr:hypothetical protein [Actinomycetota bacterium]
MTVEPEDPLKRPEVRFGVGCLVALAAIAGSLILVFLVAFALQPPAWVQVLLGVALIAGGAVLGLLVAKALGGPEGGPAGPRKLPQDGSDAPRG